MATDCKTRARFLSFSSSLGPTHPPSRRVPGFFHTTVMLMAHLQLQPNLRRYTSTPTYVFRERRLIKLRDNFTFYPQTWYLFPSTVCGSSKPLKRRARACVYVYVCVYTHIKQRYPWCLKKHHAMSWTMPKENFPKKEKFMIVYTHFSLQLLEIFNACLSVGTNIQLDF
jgi:hypothetical protein